MATIFQAFGIALEHHQAGRLQVAEKMYRQILEVDPCHVEATHLLGVIAAQTGNHTVAVEYISRAIALDPDQADFHFNLGQSYRALQKFSEAIACCRRALELTPDDDMAHNNLGNALKDQGQLVEAIVCYRRAIELQPHRASSHDNLGRALQDLGRIAEATACFQQAIELERDANAHNNLGNALKEQGQIADAIDCFRRAIALNPDCLQAHYSLGCVLMNQGHSTEAIACFQRVLQRQPDCVEARNNLGNALKDQGRMEEAISCFRQALQLNPNYAAARNNVLYSLSYCSGVTLAQLAEAHQEYERQHAAPLRSLWQPHDNLRDPDRPLRLGFVSRDFHQHPVAFFLIRALENLDRDQCAIACYNDNLVQDELTARFQAAAALWRDVAGQNDQRLAEQIRADHIDILFDLAGHSDRSRLLVFARKPAPLQITWIGYEGTTGLEAMDYLLADRIVLPESAEPYYREKVLRMSDGYVCYDPPEAPPVGPLPASDKGYTTFGCFNNPAKINPEVMAVWATILRRVPQSRLMLKYRGLGDETVKRRYLDLFSDAGVEPQRLDLLPQSSYLGYLAMYGQIDIALDPFPFSGSATTCEALWMGVPVITSPGETFASRHSLSHLTNIGLLDTIACNLDDYVGRAVALAGDLPRLAAMRAGLRDQMAASPLCDGQRFAANLMPLLRDVWRQWVQTVPPTHQPLIPNP